MAPPPPTRAQRLAGVPLRDREQFQTIYNGPRDQVPLQAPKSRSQLLKEAGRESEAQEEEGVENAHRVSTLEGAKNAFRITQKINSIFSGKGTRISNAMAFLIIGAALFIDALEMLTTIKIIGVILSYTTPIFANLMFWMWFKMLNVDIYFSSPKKLMTAIAVHAVELIPALDALGPFGAGWTVWALAIIFYTRTEDKLGIKLPTSLTSPKNAVAGTIKDTNV